MTRQPAPDLSELQVFALALTLRRGLCRHQHRRFYSQMRRAMHAMDLMLCSFKGMCLLVQTGRQPAYDYRQAVVGWLIDQQEPSQVTVHPLYPASLFLEDCMTFLSDEDDMPLPPAVEARVRELSRQMLGGLLLRRQTRRTSLGLTAP